MDLLEGRVLHKEAWVATFLGILSSGSRAIKRSNFHVHYSVTNGPLKGLRGKTDLFLFVRDGVGQILLVNQGQVIYKLFILPQYSFNRYKKQNILRIIISTPLLTIYNYRSALFSWTLCVDFC